MSKLKVTSDVVSKLHMYIKSGTGFQMLVADILLQLVEAPADTRFNGLVFGDKLVTRDGGTRLFIRYVNNGFEVADKSGAVTRRSMNGSFASSSTTEFGVDIIGVL